MFDFYASAYNYQNIAGSNATTKLIAYTATLGNIFSGLSATLSVEDENARQAGIGSTLGGAYTHVGVANTLSPIVVGGIAGTSFTGTPAGTAWPDIVGNVRVDQPWGAVQLSAAGHEARGSLFASTAYAASSAPGVAGAFGTNGSAYAFPANTTNSYGWAIQGGVQLNADYLSAGDKLWLQAAYEQGALSYVWGNKAYSNNALAGFGGAVGVSNLKAARVGTNLVWTPIKGFDIGAEFMYVNATQTRPVGLAPDAVLNNQGLPSWRGSENEYEGRIRVQRAF